MIPKICNYIRAKRKELNFTQEQVASYVGMKTNTYRDLENGNTRMRLEDLLLICKYLSIDPINLVKESEETILVLNNDQITLIEQLYNQIKEQQRVNDLFAQSADYTNIQIGDNNTIQDSFNKK